MKLTTEDTVGAELKACVKNHAKEIMAGFSSEELWRNYAEAVENLCRKLERERDELLAYLDAAHYATCNAELRKERDELREEAAAWENKWKCAVELAANYSKEREHNAMQALAYKAERDEAREKYDILATEHMLEVNKLCNERDEARREVDRYREEKDLSPMSWDT